MLRRLEREAGRIYERAAAHLAGTAVLLEPAELVVVAHGGRVVPLHRARARVLLFMLGAPQAFDEVARARRERHPCDVPLVIFVGTRVCIAWLRSATMTSGGAA